VQSTAGNATSSARAAGRQRACFSRAVLDAMTPHPSRAVCTSRRRYPYPLSKTALVAVGTQQNWPPCLAALTWLIELVQV
jgi:hypothetical protein